MRRLLSLLLLPSLAFAAVVFKDHGVVKGNAAQVDVRGQATVTFSGTTATVTFDAGPGGGGGGPTIEKACAEGEAIVAIDGGNATCSVIDGGWVLRTGDTMTGALLNQAAIVVGSGSADTTNAILRVRKDQTAETRVNIINDNTSGYATLYLTRADLGTGGYLQYDVNANTLNLGISGPLHIDAVGSQITLDSQLISTAWISEKFVVRGATSFELGEERRVTVDADAGTRTVTVPLASGQVGRVYSVKKIDPTSNPVVLTRSGSNLIDGATTYSLTTQFQVVTIASDGTDWWVY